MRAGDEQLLRFYNNPVIRLRINDLDLTPILCQYEACKVKVNNVYEVKENG
jgi:hypothetical protein